MGVVFDQPRSTFQLGFPGQSKQTQTRPLLTCMSSYEDKPALHQSPFSVREIANGIQPRGSDAASLDAASETVNLSI